MSKITTRANVSAIRDLYTLDTLGANVGAAGEAGKAYDAAVAALQSSKIGFGERLTVAALQVFAWGTGDGAVSFRRMRAEHGVTLSLASLSYYGQVGRILACHEGLSVDDVAEAYTLVKIIGSADVVGKIAEGKGEPMPALRRAANAKATTPPPAGGEGAEGAAPEGEGAEATDPWSKIVKGLSPLVGAAVKAAHDGAPIAPEQVAEMVALLADLRGAVATLPGVKVKAAPAA